MNTKEFSRIRRRLGKTQSQLAQLLGVSTKAVQSFEQGWRAIPPHVERQALFLVAMKMGRGGAETPSCWDITTCSAEKRENCPAWELQCGHLCWFVNGTICNGKPEKTWAKKMKTCRKCEVFQSTFPKR
jgi:DNA-binding XRE family transcriptional regulator